jgi:hypothetical protein
LRHSDSGIYTAHLQNPVFGRRGRSQAKLRTAAVIIVEREFMEERYECLRNVF